MSLNKIQHVMNWGGVQGISYVCSLSRSACCWNVMGGSCSSANSSGFSMSSSSLCWPKMKSSSWSSRCWSVFTFSTSLFSCVIYQQNKCYSCSPGVAQMSKWLESAADQYALRQLTTFFLSSPDHSREIYWSFSLFESMSGEEQLLKITNNVNTHSRRTV